MRFQVTGRELGELQNHDDYSEYATSLIGPVPKGARDQIGRGVWEAARRVDAFNCRAEDAPFGVLVKTRKDSGALFGGEQ